MIGSLGVPELLFILVLALLVFGPRKLPEIGRTLGRAMGEFRRATSDLKRTLDVELSSEEREAVLGAGENLARVGIVVDEFGSDAVAVRGIPAAAGAVEPTELLLAVLARLREGVPTAAADLADELISTMACKAAVKAGDPLLREQVADLLAESERLTHAHTCPHGRPTGLVIGYGELERYFKRK